MSERHTYTEKKKNRRKEKLGEPVRRAREREIERKRQRERVREGDRLHETRRTRRTTTKATTGRKKSEGSERESIKNTEGGGDSLNDACM